MAPVVVLVVRPTGGGGEELEDKVGEGANDVLVGVRGVESEVAQEKFVEVVPVLGDV